MACDPEFAIHDFDLGVGDGLADGDWAGTGFYAGDGGADGGLGGTVHVPDGGGAGEQVVSQAARHRLATAEDCQTGAALPAGFDEQTPGGGRGEDDGGFVVVQETGEELAIGGGFAGGDDEARARAEREQELHKGDVEGDGGEGDEGVAGADTGFGDHRGEEVVEAAVGDLDAFGLAGRAGGVDDVGEVVWRRGDGGFGGGGERGVGEDEADVGIGEYEGDALGGIGGVEGEADGADLPDGEDGGGEVLGAA